ncbi:Hypothetical protein HDN1F_20520 [gamma proteobacterium HdN1]|nr:Hypothetical protein HDN1F_20520 [gamma proteobacterium HdN1]
MFIHLLKATFCEGFSGLLNRRQLFCCKWILPNSLSCGRLLKQRAAVKQTGRARLCEWPICGKAVGL